MPASLERRRDGRAPDGFAAAVRHVVHAAILETGGPLDCAEIIGRLAAAGIPLPSESVAAKVTRVLRRDPDLANTGRGMFGFAQATLDGSAKPRRARGRPFQPSAMAVLRPGKRGDAPRGFAGVVRGVAHAAIREAGRPLDRNEVIGELVRAGVPLPDEYLENKVSRILRLDPELVNVRKRGYAFRADGLRSPDDRPATGGSGS